MPSFNLENKITWMELAPSLQELFKNLQSQIITERDRAIQREKELDKKIDDETNRASGVEGGLDNRITKLEDDNKNRGDGASKGGTTTIIVDGGSGGSSSSSGGVAIKKLAIKELECFWADWWPLPTGRLWVAFQYRLEDWYGIQWWVINGWYTAPNLSGAIEFGPGKNTTSGNFWGETWWMTKLQLPLWPNGILSYEPLIIYKDWSAANYWTIGFYNIDIPNHCVEVWMLPTTNKTIGRGLSFEVYVHAWCWFDGTRSKPLHE